MNLRDIGKSIWKKSHMAWHFIVIIVAVGTCMIVMQPWVVYSDPIGPNPVPATRLPGPIIGGAISAATRPPSSTSGGVPAAQPALRVIVNLKPQAFPTLQYAVNGIPVSLMTVSSYVSFPDAFVTGSDTLAAPVGLATFEPELIESGPAKNYLPADQQLKAYATVGDGI